MFRKALQVLHEPRQVTEKEDVHLIRSFAFSTKNSEAGYAVSRKNGHEKAKEHIGKDFVIIPESIWDPLAKQRGHIDDSLSYEELKGEIKKHSHGKIVKMYGPFYYDDSPEDYYYEAGIKLNGSLSSSVLLENGSKTWTKFAVSPTIWPKAGQDPYDITDWEPMGLFLVIKGAYGDEATIKKMCSGSELACGKSLSSAILTLDNNASDAYQAEVLSSFINIPDNNKHNMAQVIEQVKPKEVKEVPLEQPKLDTPVPLVKEQVKEEVKIEQPKGVTISPEEYEEYKKEREEHKQLVLENKINKLNELFTVVENEDEKKDLVNKYVDKDVNLLRQYHNDVFPHVEKFVKGKEVKVEDETKPKSSSVLKKEPQKVQEEAKSSSVIVPNNANEVLDFSRMITGDIL